MRAALLVPMLVLTACVTTPEAPPRRAPPPLADVAASQPKSPVAMKMARFAKGVLDIEAALQRETPPTAGVRDEVVGIIDEMTVQGYALAAEEFIAEHPPLAKEASWLRGQLAVARAAALEDPPDYAPAGQLASACVRCHQSRL